MTLGGVKVRPLRKRSRSTSTSNLWVFGEFRVRRKKMSQEFTRERIRDTVNSVGVIPRTLPFTKANDSIRYFRHALSLDERRVYVFQLVS